MHKNIVFMMFLQGLLQILLCNEDWSFAVFWTGPLNSTHNQVLLQTPVANSALMEANSRSGKTVMLGW